MRLAAVHHTENGCTISSPYGGDFLTDLKAAVPPFARTWNAEEKHWRIAKAWAGIAVRVTKQYFTVMEAGKEHARSQAPPWCDCAHYDPTSAHSALHLLPSAPPELIKVAYRCLAQPRHPDHGGDPETMKRINRADGELAT
jgi:hypothetical protein